MDRQKKLILVGAGGLLLLIAIIVLVVLVVRDNRQPVEPEPAPIETIEPTATPTETPTPTPVTTPVEPGQPVLPREDATPTPEPTPVATATPAATPTQTTLPTPKPTDAGSPNLPSGASTPTPSVTPQSSPVPNTTTPSGNIANAGGFAFGLPKNAFTDTVVTVSVLSGIEAVTWSITKDGSEIALADAFAGTLKDDGGMVVFKDEGSYMLMGTTTDGYACNATVIVLKRK